MCTYKYIYIFLQNWGVHSKTTPIKVHIEITRDHGICVMCNAFM